MNNPWLTKYSNFNTLESNYVIDCEDEIITEFNNSQSDKRFAIRKDVYPASYSPNLESAKIIILMANPGYDENEKDDHENFDFVNKSINILLGKKVENGFASDYWYNKLNPLIQELNSAGLDGTKTVEDYVALVEFFPYHSEKYKPLGKRLLEKHSFGSGYLPTQEWIFEQLAKTFEREPIFICIRNRAAWEKVFENKGYDIESGKFYSTNSYLNSIISRNNFTKEDGAWEKIVEILK